MSVFWKKIEFCKVKSDNKAMLFGSLGSGTECWWISHKYVWFFNVCKVIKRLTMALRKLFSWPKKLYQLYRKYFSWLIYQLLAKSNTTKLFEYHNKEKFTLAIWHSYGGTGLWQVVCVFRWRIWCFMSFIVRFYILLKFLKLICNRAVYRLFSTLSCKQFKIEKPSTEKLKLKHLGGVFEIL